MELAAQIPVSTAMEILSFENAEKMEIIKQAEITLDSDRTKYPVKLFIYIVDNKQLALSSMINANSWKVSEQTFLEFVSLNVNQNGFNSKVFELTYSDRSLLFSYLKQILER